LLKRIVIFVIVLSFCGCAKLRHLPRLLIIKGYSENKDAQAEFVKEQNANFEKISSSIEEGTIGQYKTWEEIQRTFGEPIFSRIQEIDGEEVEVWLYRKGKDFSPEEKAYLHFDSEGNLLEWERIFSPERKKKISDAKYKGGPG